MVAVGGLRTRRWTIEFAENPDSKLAIQGSDDRTSMPMLVTLLERYNMQYGCWTIATKERQPKSSTWSLDQHGKMEFWWRRFFNELYTSTNTNATLTTRNTMSWALHPVRQLRTQREDTDVMKKPKEDRWLELLNRVRFTTTKTDDKPRDKLARARWRRAMFIIKRMQAANLLLTPVGGGKLRHPSIRLLTKDMDTGYWLELIDPAHRYGSNLKYYHSVWKDSDTKQNFFYWLDFGEGKNLEIPECSREQLNREKIVYLNAEQRKHYLTSFKNGRIVWKLTGQPVTTDNKNKEEIREDYPIITDYLDETSSSGYHVQGKATIPRVKKCLHLNVVALIEKALRKSPIQKNAWMFVTDSQFNLYVGAKEAGKFQHTSFLAGGRVTCAGLIQIKEGILMSLAPLSGHYKCSSKHFELFVNKLEERGVNTTHVKIDWSLRLLKGLEMMKRWKNKKREKMKGKTK
ncbi:hypothetical protein PROFUN_05328 [Planoprotostelium fungivorum]|uniref:Uncharacterized protein n=1 Tax=Planoprotostelium fungivorum TaxID=1890364 RepID=A0A2P6NR17_9EUKA|nr:hypothetical protein PROFUN_05328 [Planoprotostelium fungivorum]